MKTLDKIKFYLALILISIIIITFLVSILTSNTTTNTTLILIGLCCLVFLCGMYFQIKNKIKKENNELNKENIKQIKEMKLTPNDNYSKELNELIDKVNKEKEEL